MFFAEPTSIRYNTTARRRHPIVAFAFGALLTVTAASTVLAQDSEIVAVYDASLPPNVDVAFELETLASVAGYIWSFGDGQYSYDAQPVHTYTQEGEFVVSVDVTTTSGTNFSVTAADLVVINNQILTDDFDSPMDPMWGAEAGQNQEPYGSGMAMGFWIHRGGSGNSQMPNAGIGVSNGSGSGGGTDCIKNDCPFPIDQGLFRFQVEFMPMALASGAEMTIFRLDGADVEIQFRWQFGALQARTVFQHVKTSWQTLGMMSNGAKSNGGVKGRFDVALILATPGVWSDTLDVFWTPSEGSSDLTWHSTTFGALPWSDLTIGAFDIHLSTAGGLDPQGQVWFDNFEILRHSLGGVPLE